MAEHEDEYGSLIDALDRGDSAAIAEMARAAGWPADTCGHCCASPKTGDHPRFCAACVEQHARFDECGPTCSAPLSDRFQSPQEGTQ